MTTTTADPHAIAQAKDAFSDAWAAETRRQLHTHERHCETQAEN